MKIVAENHAETCIGRDSNLPALRDGLLLAAIGQDLRGLYDGLDGEMPSFLIELARRLDRDNHRPVGTA